MAGNRWGSMVPEIRERPLSLAEGATHARRPVEGTLILDRYRPLDELGQGGFGTVTLAWDTRMQRRVAIKRLALPLDARGNPHRPPGLAEARTAAMLNHPNIVTVFDFDTDADEAFLVMEYVDGASLATVLDTIDGPLDPDEAAAVVHSVAEALDFAHENGVLHLDIKPENVLVTRDGRVKVADFGLAELSSATGHGSAFGGTPGYMPPEQLSGGAVSERTDTWSFGVLVYESLTGANPFVGTARAGDDEIPPPSENAEDVSPELDDVVMAALAERPAARFGSAGEFADELLPLLGDPAKGRRSLAEIVADAVEDSDDEDVWLDRVGLWDRLGGRLGSTLVRTGAALEAGWLAWAGLSPLGLDRTALLAASGLVAAGGALSPQLGVGLGLGCMIAGLAAAGAPLAAAGLAVGGGAWWWLVARRSAGAAVLPLGAPVLGAVRLPFAQAMLAGFALRPLPAAVTALLGGALAMLASATTLHTVPYTAVAPWLAVEVWQAGLSGNSVSELVRSPAAWVALAGWPTAAALMSLACSRATRLGAALGAVGGSAVLAGAHLLATRVAQATGSVTPEAWSGRVATLGVTGSLILMLLVVALGAPRRPEEEPVRRRATTED